MESLSDKRISFAICFQITVVGIKNMLVQAVPALYTRNSLLNIILFAFVAMIYVRAFFSTQEPLKINRQAFIILFFLLISYVYSLFFFPGNTSFIIDELPRTVPYCFLTWFMITKLTSFEWIEYYMRKFSVAIILLAVVSAAFIFIAGHITTSTWSTYSMPLSYVTMVGVMWSLMIYFDSDKPQWLLLALVGILVIIMYGSRNPLIAIAVYVGISVLRKSIDISKGTKRIKYILLCIALICAFIWMDQLLTLMGSILNSVGISSRTIELLTEFGSSDLFTSGRDVIHSSLLGVMNEHFFFGLGIGGDQAALYSLGMTQSAHSLYLSILSSYGYIVGSFVLGYLVYLCIKALRLTMGHEKEVLIMYMCMVWPRGFTGGDVWSSDVFWWMFGLVFVAVYGYKSQLCKY